MLTEEAKTKQCRIFPFIAQIWGPVEGTTNIEHIPSKCCADECMHWRWHEEFVTDHLCETFLNEDRRLEYKPRPVLSKTSGYCGLSGKVGAE